MRNSKFTFVGFLFFFLTLAFNISLGIVIYSKIENQENWVIAIFVLLFIVFTSLVCTVIDVIRRKLMIDKPLKEILKATDSLARGNFKIVLIPSHSYKNYDEFDYIKEDLNKMAKELSKSEILKNDFIANVSHEIKTPLMVIQSYAKALNNKKIDEETKNKYLESLQESCNKLANLVTNILKLNKLENKKLYPEITRFNLSELMANQVLQFEKIIESKAINLTCDIEEDLYIKSEESYLEIIINNLMSNAIKFTPNEGDIKVSLIKIDNEYIIKVKDTGCGLTVEEGKHIFDKFYQADTSHTKEGNGLGLSLVKKVIDILGGTISVESEKDVGSTFVVVVKEIV